MALRVNKLGIRMYKKYIPKLDDSVSPPMNLDKGTHSYEKENIIACKRNASPLEKIYSMISMGNRCAHNKYEPRSFLAPAHHLGRPYFLVEAADRVAQNYFKRTYLKLFKKIQKRFKRSERMEAITVVLQVLLHYVDIVSFRVGIFLEGCIKPIRLFDEDKFSIYREVNRGKADNEKFGLKRITRALGDLERAGYLDVLRRNKITRSGNFKGLVAIRSLTDKFFLDLGFSEKRIKHEQKRRAKQLVKEEHRRSEGAFVREFIREIEKEKESKAAVLDAREFADAKIEAGRELLVDIQKLYPSKKMAQLSILAARLKIKKPPPT